MRLSGYNVKEISCVLSITKLLFFRTFVIDIFTEIGVQEPDRYFLRELDEFDTWVSS